MHDSMVRRIVDIARDAGVAGEIDLSVFRRYRNPEATGAMPDLILLLPTGSHSMTASDVTIPNPAAQNYVAQARKNPKVALTLAERAKTTQNTEICAAQGMGFVPGVMLTTLAVGPELYMLMQRIANKIGRAHV